jgi:hypothetical protein
MSPDFEPAEEEPTDIPVEAIEADDNEELKQLQEEGVLPMTPAPEPEDASFLEEDPMASSGFEEESLDLSEAVIDEPDLSADIKDNPVEEPSLEAISIELEMDDAEFASEAEDADGTEAAGSFVPLEEEVSLELPEETLELPAEETGEDSFEQEPADDLSIDLPPLEEPVLEESFEETETEETAGESFPSMEAFGESIDLSGGETAVEEPAVDEAAAEFDIPIIEDEEEEENPVSPESSAEAEDDLTLIPEGFVIESDGSGGAEETDDDGPSGDDFLSPIDGEAEISGEPEEAPKTDDTPGPGGIPSKLKHELKTVLSYMDQLLESLPDEKIEEFARSEYFDTYKKLFRELGLV